jgi:hypothetical protein
MTNDTKTIVDGLVNHARSEYTVLKKWQFVDGLTNWIREQIPTDDDVIQVHWRERLNEGGDEWDRLQIEGFLRWLLKDIPDNTHMVDPAPYSEKKESFFDCHFEPKARECAFCPDRNECPWERNGGRH